MNLALLSGERMDLGDLEQECNGCPDDVAIAKNLRFVASKRDSLC